MGELEEARRGAGVCRGRAGGGSGRAGEVVHDINIFMVGAETRFYLSLNASAQDGHYQNILNSVFLNIFILQFYKMRLLF